METKLFKYEVSSMAIQTRKRTIGRVRWYSTSLCYGFVREEDRDEDIFFHKSAIQVPGNRVIREGQRVVFERCTTSRGLCAINLVPIAENTANIIEDRLKNIVP